MDVSLSVSDHIVSNRFTARVHCRCVTLSSPIDSGLPAARAVQVVAGRCVRSAAGPMMDVRRRVCPVRVQWASYRRSSTRQMSCSAADIVTSSCDHWSPLGTQRREKTKVRLKLQNYLYVLLLAVRLLKTAYLKFYWTVGNIFAHFSSFWKFCWQKCLFGAYAALVLGIL